MNKYGETIQIEIVAGGFILTYPVITKATDGSECQDTAREVFASPRKLQNKIKELISSLGLVAQDG